MYTEKWDTLYAIFCSKYSNSTEDIFFINDYNQNISNMHISDICTCTINLRNNNFLSCNCRWGYPYKRGNDLTPTFPHDRLPAILITGFFKIKCNLIRKMFYKYTFWKQSILLYVQVEKSIINLIALKSLNKIKSLQLL